MRLPTPNQHRKQTPSSDGTSSIDPIIFKGLKTLVLADTQQQTLLRLAAEGISVYSPHTAIDCAPGGLGDFLADIVSGTRADPHIAEDYTPEEAPARAASPTKRNTQSRSVSPTKRDINPTPLERDDPFAQPPKRPVFHLQHHPSQLSIKDSALNLATDNHTRRPITACKVPGYEKSGAGMGRIVRFKEPQPLLSIIDRIGLGLGNPKGFPIAIPQGKQMNEILISSVAICAGSGGGLFAGLGKNGEEDVDLLFTGELSHHEALAAIEQSTLR